MENLTNLTKTSVIERVYAEGNLTSEEVLQLLNNKEDLVAKKSIISELLDKEQITVFEAELLLNNENNFQRLDPLPITYPMPHKTTDGRVPYHELCGCTICNCVMGNKLVDPNMNSNINTTNTFEGTFTFNKTIS